jgi:hypothetical protein
MCKKVYVNISSRQSYSPEGPAKVVPSFAGVPKFGVPSEFQLTFCAIVYLLPSQDPVLIEVAWKTFQISVLSGLLKNLHCC